MVFVGLLFAGRQETTEEYLLAGRNMPWLVVGMSMFASLTSAISYMGIPGRAYEENVAYVVTGFVSLATAPILIVLFYPFYRLLHVTTSYDYILRRYGQSARTAVSGLFFCSRLGWLGTVIYAPALAISVVTPIPLWVAILLIGMLATAYTVMGGLTAVMQFGVLVGGAIWVAISLTLNVPGGTTSILDIADKSGRLSIFEMRFSLIEMTGIGVALSYFLELLQSYGTDQVTVQRMLAISTSKCVTKTTIFNSVSDILTIGLLLYVGIGLFAYFQVFTSRLSENLTGDRILPFYIMHALPNGVSGLVITAIFAAAMSSMDSGINSLSTVIVNDFVQPWCSRQTAREVHNMSCGRTQVADALSSENGPGTRDNLRQKDVTTARLLKLALGLLRRLQLQRIRAQFGACAFFVI